jgi:hypothetical protein
MKELVRGLVEKRTPNGICVLRAHYTADPERRGPEWKERERRKYTSESAWQADQEIVFGAGGGERLFADTLNRYGHKILIDPETSGFQPSPDWDYFGGFDAGKANPTAALVACIDFDGTIYILREYYQPGLSPMQHAPFLRRLWGFHGIPIHSDPSIFYANQAQNDGTFKAIASLYDEEGIDNLTPAPENNELLGMERILRHWMNLERQEPTLKMLCPERSRDIAKPQFGVHNEGCPNLLWELRRARRAELTPNQLVTKNPTEKIIDKDNHLRDCLKYLLLTMPNPTAKSWQMKAAEAIAPLSAAGEHTLAYFKYRQMEAEARGRNGEYLQMEAEARGRTRRIHLGRPRIRRY